MRTLLGSFPKPVEKGPGSFYSDVGAERMGRRGSRGASLAARPCASEPKASAR